MIVLACDPSKSTGLAEWNTKQDMSSIWATVLRMPDDCDALWYAVQLERKLIKIIKERGKPDIGVVEQQSGSSMGNSLEGVIYTWGGAQIFCATLGVYGIPVVRMAPQTWHAMFFGKGFKPPQKPVRKKVQGKIVTTFENDWKAACVDACERQGIVLPTQKTIAHNAADAAALAICWRGGTPINPEYHPRFMELVQRRNSKVAA